MEVDAFSCLTFSKHSGFLETNTEGC